MAEASHLLYRRQMLEIKCRFLAIDRILGAKKPRTYNEEFDNEFIWLQLRKIVELITFSAIAADEARYAAKRSEDGGNNNYRKDGKVGKILEHLQQISPHFLPQPMGAITVNPDGTRHIGYGATQATLDRLKGIHETAGEGLHARNPFDPVFEANKASAKVSAREQIRVELAYLKGVIWVHFKIGLEWADGGNPRDLANSGSAWLIDFGKPDAPGIQMKLATALPTSSV